MSKNYYINGSTVRRLEAEPVRREKIDRRKIEEERRKKSRRNAARRNRERELYMGRGHVAFLSVCVVLVAFAAISMVQTQSQITQRMRHITTMERQLTELRADNDAKQKEIATSVDLNYIKDVAINQLGMHYATEDQIVYYNVTNSNFMDQYSDIPKE